MTIDIQWKMWPPPMISNHQVIQIDHESSQGEQSRTHPREI